MTTSHCHLRADRRRARARGFTLVELMVAMTGGLFLSIVVFALSRDATRFYQREVRVANATLSGIVGLDRLASDIGRAGHMSTPNIGADPRVCNRPSEGWPDGVERLRAVVLDTSGTTTTGTEVEAAGVTPHAITVSGSFDTTEELYSNTIEPAATGYRISINRDTPAAMRLGLSATTTSAAANLAVLSSTFMVGNVGRIVRIRKDGKEQYGVVSSVTSDADTAVVNLSDNPPLQFRAKGAVQCGIDGVGKDYGISIINVVRYELASMTADATYAALFDAARSAPSEDKRAELVRVELAPDGAEIDGTREIVAEYAVDLRFAPWAATSDTNPSVIAVAPDTYTPSAGSPQLIRGMHVRLSVRSREEVSRVRTFQSDVPLRNLEKSNWPG